MMMIDNENNEKPKRRGRFVNRVNAVTPLVTLFISFLMILIATRNVNLWEQQGFNNALGILLGSGATGTLTQRDEGY